MKGLSVLLLIAVGLSSTIRCLNLTTIRKNAKSNRNLSAADAIDEQISKEVSHVSIEQIREEITDLHKNVKICIDEEFQKEPSDILPFDEILRICAGDNYAIVIRFYNDVNFSIKEIVKERIKGDLKNGFCDNILNACIDYFRALEIFISKDYDIMKAIELNRPELERKIDPDRLDYLVQITEQEIGDYNAIRQDLLNERKFLTAYFTERFNVYKAKYGQAAYMRSDSLINGEEENTTVNINAENGLGPADPAVGVPVNDSSAYQDSAFDDSYFKK